MVIYAGGDGEDLHIMCYSDLCLEPTMARVTGERDPSFTSAELERLVDGVLPQYGLLYGPPDQQVSAHQKKGIWRAIANDRWQTEHPLSETVGGPETLGMEDGGGPAGDGLPTKKQCPLNPDPPDGLHTGGGLA
ncbi:hypothetical protein NDU88_003204 [Pleurodeles waltl]|uniref:Uncharacterized protein n=1 Tax=Pleurodeles waltl TaxID=8319 RepID=A0AAV7MZH4_PLEWA|nr:hypothetical protein NDU88_003204 [Pleurodeles waltl]